MDEEKNELAQVSSDPAKPKKMNEIGRVFYGEGFKGFGKIGELKDLIPTFKEYYYEEKVKNFRMTPGDIIRKFNQEVAYPQNRTFHPYTNQFKIWRTKWDRDILEKNKGGGLEITEQKQILQIINTRDKDDNIVLGAPGDGELEAGARTLAGELTNDALTMLRDDQALEELYTDEELLRRRNYIVNVFSHVTKLVHGKAALLLKASQEKRENASFLMNLLAKATSGKITEEEIDMLGTTYSTPKQNEPEPAHV